MSRNPWSNGHGNDGTCRNCGKNSSSKPAAHCREIRHATRWTTILDNRRRSGFAWRWQIRLDVIEIFGGRCVRCGETDPRVLQVNHIDGNGSEDRKSNQGARNLWRKIAYGHRSTDGLNLLCANCNVIYEYDQGRRWWPGA